MRKGTIAVIAFSLAVPLSFIGSASRAYAASCYASSCTGKSAVAEGCSADAYTAEQAIIYLPSNKEIGYVQLRYSPTCRSTWAKVYSIGWVQNQVYAIAENSQGNKSLYETCDAPQSPTVGGSYPYECQTNMIDDLNPLTSDAYGNATTIYGQTSGAITSPPF